MLVFEERRKPEYQEKNLSGRAKEGTNNKLDPHMESTRGFEPRSHWWEGECSNHPSVTLACEQALCLGKIIAMKWKGKGWSSPLDQRPVHRLLLPLLPKDRKVNTRVGLRIFKTGSQPEQSRVE